MFVVADHAEAARDEVEAGCLGGVVAFMVEIGLADDLGSAEERGADEVAAMEDDLKAAVRIAGPEPVTFSRICGVDLWFMPHYRIAVVADLFGVSDDTVRRWVDSGALDAGLDDSGRRVIEGSRLAGFARAQAITPRDPSTVGRSARNRFVGLVTAVIEDKVMAQVEMQCGPHRVVSLMSSEAVRDLGLEPGVLGIAVVKSTHVVIETAAPA